MTKIRHYFDAASLITIVITFALFVTALYFTGLTHDLLLEAGVFLVSVKLILMSYKNKVASDDLNKELKEIRSLIQEMNRDSKRDEPKAAPPSI
jgi:Skp family chaperone for outer membrane proteins